MLPRQTQDSLQMLWLAVYLMGLPPTGLYTLSWTHGLPPMFFPVNQDILYKEFGVDAELLIDHAWGLEPCGMKEIKATSPALIVSPKDRFSPALTHMTKPESLSWRWLTA